MKRATILGAGISGLTCAWHLKRSGWEVSVLEAGDRVGGSILTHRQGPYLAEAGPNTLMLNDRRVQTWIHDLGLDDELVIANPQARKRFLASGGAFHPVPMSPLSLISTPLLSGKAKRRLLAEPFIRPPRDYPEDESLADFVRRRLGPEVLENMVQPVVSGIFAGDPERLSVAGAFPLLPELERTGGSLIRGMLKRKKSPQAVPRQMISFQGGLQCLPDAITRDLGPAIETGCRVEALTPNEKGDWSVVYRRDGEEKSLQGPLITAVPAHVLSGLPWPEDLSGALQPLDEIVHPPLLSITSAYKREDVPHPLDGFGGLIPASEKQPLLGVLFISTLFPGRCPADEVLLTMFLGGRLSPDQASGSESEVLMRCSGVLQRYLGIEAKPVFTQCHHWAHSIPQPERGHHDRLKTLETLESDYPGLHFLGNYRGGVSLGQCLISAFELAKTISGNADHPLE
jgi:oxygen-dependent protoporphyrinogen oxidase